MLRARLFEGCCKSIPLWCPSEATQLADKLGSVNDFTTSLAQLQPSIDRIRLVQLRKMDPIPVVPNERKTCIACTKGKRKCDKGDPSCQRCLDKGLACQYPRVRRYARLGKRKPQQTLGINQSPTLCGLSPRFSDHFSAESASSSKQSAEDAGGDLNVSEGLDLSLVKPPAESLSLDEWWLSGPKAWTVDGSTASFHELPTHHISALSTWIGEIREWLSDWIENGHNAFIHEQLYSNTGLPACLQDCWSTLTAYNAKTKSNEIITMGIVQSRAEALTADRCVEDGLSSNLPTLRTIDHLARVQALFIYQFIRLFDGDIRQRNLAEEEFFVLQDWCDQLWKSATLGVCAEDDHWPVGLYNNTNLKAKLWGRWVLGESVRRTWYLCKILYGVYFTLRDGWTVCPGAVRFTARRAIWEASSPTEWAELAQNKPLLLVSGSYGDDQLFTTAKYNDVDLFSKLLLKLLWGSHRVQEWATISSNDQDHATCREPI